MNEKQSSEPKANESLESVSPVEEPKPVGDTPSKRAPHDDLAKVKEDLAEAEEKMSRFERSTLRWTRASFIVILFTGLFIALQWLEMRSSGKDTQQLAIAASKQADRMKDFADQMRRQADETHDLAVSAGKQADASKALADLTAQQFAASQRLVESQRASISVAFASVLNPVSFHDGALSFAFAVILKNNGRLPANRVKVRYKSYFSQWGESMFSEPMRQQRDFCAKPNLLRLRKDLEDLRGLTSDDALTIIPGEMKEWQINFSTAVPTDSDIIEWPPPQYKVPQTKRVYPIVVGCVDYQSGAMTQPHQTGFIFEIERGDHTFITLGEGVRREDVIVTQYFFGQGKSY